MVQDLLAATEGIRQLPLPRVQTVQIFLRGGKVLLIQQFFRPVQQRTVLTCEGFPSGDQVALDALGVLVGILAQLLFQRGQKGAPNAEVLKLEELLLIVEDRPDKGLVFVQL